MVAAPVDRVASTTAADFDTMAHAMGCAFSVIMAWLIRTGGRRLTLEADGWGVGRIES
jgi:hypothetical protein